MSTLITEEVLRDIIIEALDSHSPSPLGSSSAAPVLVNPNVDGSGTMIDITPVECPETPHTVQEFDVSLRGLSKNLPNEVIPRLWSQIYAIIASEVKRATTAETERYNDMKKNSVYESLRRSVRSLVSESLAEIDVNRNNEDEIKDDDFGGSVDPLDTTDVDAETTSAWDPDADADDDEKPKPAGDTTRDDTFAKLAAELDISVAGVKRLEREGLKKMAYMQSLGTEEIALFVEETADKYIDYLVKEGGDDLSVTEIEFLRTELDAVIELEGFRDYLHKEIRKSMQADDLWDATPEDFMADDVHAARTARLDRDGRPGEKRPRGSRTSDDDVEEGTDFTLSTAPVGLDEDFGDEVRFDSALESEGLCEADPEDPDAWEDVVGGRDVWVKEAR